MSLREFLNIPSTIFNLRSPGLFSIKETASRDEDRDEDLDEDRDEDLDEVFLSMTSDTSILLRDI